jgi:glyoxylase I family protein
VDVSEHMSLRAHGLRAVDHVGLTVPDLDAAVRFLVDVVGGVELFRHGPYEPGPTTATHFARHPESRVVGIAMVRIGVCNVELLEYDAPDEFRRWPAPSDWGGHHLALYVDDLDGAVADLRDRGIEVLGAPMPLPGPESGPEARFVFFRAPWGAFFELVSYPQGKRYESETSLRLFDPRALPPC